MTESWGASSKVIQLLQQVQHTGVFLRMAAIELRRIAEQAPEIARELQYIAQKLDAEARDLAGGDDEAPSPLPAA